MAEVIIFPGVNRNPPETHDGAPDRCPTCQHNIHPDIEVAYRALALCGREACPFRPAIQSAMEGRNKRKIDGEGDPPGAA